MNDWTDVEDGHESNCMRCGECPIGHGLGKSFKSDFKRTFRVRTEAHRGRCRMTGDLCDTNGLRYPCHQRIKKVSGRRIGLYPVCTG